MGNSTREYKKTYDKMKALYDEYIVLIKNGYLVETYERDASLVSMLKGFKLLEEKKANDIMKVCKFNVKSIYSLREILEKEKINYVILNKKERYNLDSYDDSEVDFGEENHYSEYITKAKRYSRYYKRIEHIYYNLMDQINDKYFEIMLERVENILNEK